MKKYIPSIQNNNDLKLDIISDLAALIYKLNNNKYNQSISKEIINSSITLLSEEKEELLNSVGTGKENIFNIYKSVKSNLDQVKKNMEQPLSIKMENSIDDLLFTVNMFKEVFNGNLTDIDNENSKEVKLGWSKKRLNSKLKELRDIKQEYVVNEKRLENEIVTIEKELAELEEKMINEDNERILNELYRRISSAKSKIDSLNIRRSNYSVCFNLLDMIELNISEIIQAGKYTTSELNKAKGMLNMGRLRETAVNPEKALPILKLIQDDVNKIHEKVSSVDEKVFGNVINQTTITSDAMKYKEELLKKRREKEILNINNNELGLEQNTKPKPTNKGEQ